MATAEMKPFPYEDILDAQRPVNPARKPMSMLDRAAQFSPFAALNGYEGCISEAGRHTDQKREPDEETARRINSRLHFLADAREAAGEVELVYFQKDTRKEGGATVTLRGTVRRVDFALREIRLTGGKRVPFDDIYDILCPACPPTDA